MTDDDLAEATNTNHSGLRVFWGLVGAVIASAAGAFILVLIHIRFSMFGFFVFFAWTPILVGFLVGVTTRAIVGRASLAVAVTAAILALAGCLAGTFIGLLMIWEPVGQWQDVWPSVAKATVRPLNLPFFLLAALLAFEQSRVAKWGRDRAHPPARPQGAGSRGAGPVTATDQGSAKPLKRSRRTVILGTVGLVVILGLAVFCVAVVAPLRHTHIVLRDTWNSPGSISRAEFGRAIERLGDQERAAARLALYLRLPECATTNYRKQNATYLLRFCGEWAVPSLVELFSEGEQDLRGQAFAALGVIGPDAREAIPALVKALYDADADVRSSAAWVLGCIGPEAKAAVPGLERLLEDAAPAVRENAAEALKKIRGEE